MSDEKKASKTAKSVPSPDTLADAIIKIGGAMKQLTKSGLNRKAIVVLIKDQSGVPKCDIERVLNSLGSLADHYAK